MKADSYSRTTYIRDIIKILAPKYENTRGVNFEILLLVRSIGVLLALFLASPSITLKIEA